MECFSGVDLDAGFVAENMMGPNPLRMIAELTESVPLHPGMRVLDLGCGRGLTSIYLAKKYDVEVFAVDLWIGATENYGRIQKLGLERRIIPIHADANALPFADHYFDAVLSVDAYHYFGRERSFMEEKLSPLVRPGGSIALAFPGLKKEFCGQYPPDISAFWSPEDLATWHSISWWRDLLSHAGSIVLRHIGEMACERESWEEWLRTGNEYAQFDRRAMEAGMGNYLNMISIIAEKRH